jgi:hypothetical protein
MDETVKTHAKNAVETLVLPLRSTLGAALAARGVGLSRSPGRPRDSTRRSLLAAGLVTMVLVLSSASGLLPLNDAAAAPRVTAQPAQAIPLAAVATQGSGFSKESSGRLIWSDSGDTLKTFRTNKQGRFATTVRLPDVVAGRYEIVARVGRTTQRIAIQVSDPVRGPVALGIFQPNAPSQDALNRAADLLSREPEIVMWYQHWGFPDTRQLVLEHLRRVANLGAVPMITWEPWDPSRRSDAASLPTKEPLHTPGR